MTVIPIGTVIKDLQTQDQFVVIGYRATDDTVMCTDVQASRLVRLDANHAALIVSLPWDSEGAGQWRANLRNRLIDHLGTGTAPVALMVSDQLDHAGEVLSL